MAVTTATDTNHIRAGALSGLIAGVALAILTGVMGLLPLSARLVGSTSSGVGFIVQVVLGVILGMLFAYLFRNTAVDGRSGAGWGLVYGLILWFLLALLVMPLALGMGSQMNAPGISGALRMLWAYLVYGLILGLLYPYFARLRRFELARAWSNEERREM